MGDSKARIGVAGLGVMGASLTLNIAEHGFDVAVWNRSAEKTEALIGKAGPLAARLSPAETLADLAGAIAPPRAILMMVKAGPAVDEMIAQLLPHLDDGDTLIDAGNADFNDTIRREADLAAKGLHFIGLGVSGGEEGARHGPSMMAGGPADGYEAIADILEAIAARFDGAPCVAHFGPDGAGHFVKTVHNGIEYADMQLIAETYDLLAAACRRPGEMAALFQGWAEGPLNSYLIEITAKILALPDPETGLPVLEVIRDAAGQKGTGRWTVIEALKLGQGPLTLAAAVTARVWSSETEARAAGAGLLPAPESRGALLDTDLEAALLAARIIAYGQGFSLLQAAALDHGWPLDLPRVAEVWRAGCIIRSTLLDDIASAFRDGAPEGQLAFAPAMVTRLAETLPALRRVVAHAAATGTPVPAFASALAWLDTMRHARGPASLIQAQRDFFGAHGFERTDRGGTGFHGPWA